MTFLTRLIAILVLSLSAAPLFAQSATTQTTASAAISATDRNIVVASATGISAGYVLVVDFSEAMTVTSAYSSGTTIPVARGGYGGTPVTAHPTSAVIVAGAPARFAAEAPTPGLCTSTNYLAMPLVVIKRFISMYDCTGPSSTTQSWQQYIKDGFAAFSYGQWNGRASAYNTYTTSTAIVPQPGLVFVNGSTLAMTIIDPTVLQNGLTMCVVSTNASAHTLTYTAGFNGGTTARDVATYGGAVGDNVCFFANAGTWWVISTRNVTFG